MINILKRYYFLIIIIIFLFSFYFFKIDNYFTFQFLQKNYLLVEEFIDTYPVFSFFGFYIIHFFLLAFYVPSALVAYITAGFFFVLLILFWEAW